MASLYDRISKGTMTIDEITESIKAATSEGGKFYQSMEKQSQTLSGQLATLQDNWNELLGSVTSGMSSEASNEMLPLVNNMIAELQSAFDRGGYDGLINAATDMIPDLLGMLTGKLEDAISGLMRWLPQGIDAIMGAVPSAIKSASSTLPQITNALFSVASVVITDLIGMLPELIPVVVEGVASMVESVAAGIPQIFDSIGDGIEKAIHTGQQKVAGMWVDTDIVAKYDFDVDVDVGADEAVGEVEQAYTDIRDALSTDLLTDEQRAAIIEMIGEDESAIKAKLMEFGISETEAAQIATEISTGSATITAALEGLDVGVDRKTIAKWMIQANTSNTKLIHFCREAGLSDSDIDAIVGVFNTANGRLSSETPSFAETIYKTLTDGLTDDEKTIAGLKEDVQTWSETALSEAEEGYNAAVAELDPDAPDYKQRLADLNAEYEATKTEIQSIRDSSYVIIDNLAGQSTQSVENAYQTIADIETRVNALEERIDVLRGKTTDQAEQAFKVVTAGGKADEDTINLAVAFKFNEFQLDKQAAEDAYNDAVNELNQALANNEITVDQYNTGMKNAEAEKQAAIDAATQEYQKAFGEILMGISKSEGYDTALEESAGKQAAWSLLQAVKAGFEDNDTTFEEYAPIVQQRIVDALNTILGGDIEHVETMDNGRMLYLIDDIFANSLEDYTGDSLSPKAAAVLANALNDGATLVGTSFDTTDTNQQLLALLSSCFADPNGTVSLEARAVVKSATDAMSDAEGAEAAGDETINGLRTSLVGGVNMTYTIGKNTGYAYARGYREAADIRSPSRVMRKLGDQTGKGLEIGLTESMKSAVSTAERIMGGLTTSADLSRITRVNMPELRQEITLAAEASATPVNLDGHQIAKIQGQNNASQLSWLRARSARGYGQK